MGRYALLAEEDARGRGLVVDSVARWHVKREEIAGVNVAVRERKRGVGV